MGNISFIDNSDRVKAELEKLLIEGLIEAAGEVQGQAAQNTPVDTGQLKGSWKYIVDADKLEATIGSPLENAIFTEYGTGEYALEGNGRKGGWKYKDAKGEWHYTRGKPPMRMLHNAFITKKPTVKKLFEDKLRKVK